MKAHSVIPVIPEVKAGGSGYQALDWPFRGPTGQLQNWTTIEVTTSCI